MRCYAQLFHLQFTWDSDEEDDYGEGHLSYHATAVPRIGDEVGLTYKDDDDLPELTTVSGTVEMVHWSFDDTAPTPRSS